MEDVENNFSFMNPLNIMHDEYSKDYSILSNIKWIHHLKHACRTLNHTPIFITSKDMGTCKCQFEKSMPRSMINILIKHVHKQMLISKSCFL